MKNQLLLVLAISFLLMNCKDSEKKEVKDSEKTEDVVKTPKKSNYLGTWSRSFAMSAEQTAEVSYVFWNDSIQYEMKGPMQRNYTLIKDTITNDRWIGDKEGEKYVVFIKDRTLEKITLLKMKSKDIETALKMPFPSDSTRSKFSSWNTYSKNK